MAQQKTELDKPWYKDKQTQGIVASALGLAALVFKVDLGMEAGEMASQVLAGAGILWAFGSRVYERLTKVF